ncbi:hypothetical protein ACFL0K_02115 [Patescibacteria group bacterium]
MKTLTNLIVVVILVAFSATTNQVFAGPESIALTEGSYEVAWFKDSRCSEVKEAVESVVAHKKFWGSVEASFTALLDSANSYRKKNGLPLVNQDMEAFLRKLSKAGFSESIDVNRIYYNCLDEGEFFPPEDRGKLAKIKNKTRPRTAGQ